VDRRAAWWVVLVAGVWWWTRSAPAQAAWSTAAGYYMATNTDYDDIFQSVAAGYGLDWKLLKAVAMHESSLNAAAVNAGDPSNPSYGLMQISCRPDGAGGCDPAQFPGLADQGLWPPSGGAQQLLDDVAYNVGLGAAILAEDLQRYGYPRGIAVYNNYSARTSPVNGPFPAVSQAYVDAVLKNYSILQGA
jgi:soluble lytic murein transglycosylase-like protein